MKLSIIIPVYNEENFVAQSLTNLAKTEFILDTEFIIVNDASTDQSLAIIKQWQTNSTKNVIIINKTNNEGKGSAIRAGLKQATGDIIAFHDADLEYDPNDLKMLVNELLKLNQSAVIFGSRFLKQETNWIIPSHYIGNKLLSFLVSFLCQHQIGDMETCYKVFYAQALKNISLISNRFEIEPEITIKFLRQGLNIKEIPINYYPRTFNEGKKINYQDGLTALMAILKFRFESKK